MVKKIGLLLTMLCVANVLNGMKYEEPQRTCGASGEFNNRMRINDEKRNLLNQITANYQRQLQELDDKMIHQLCQECCLKEKSKIRDEWQKQKKALEKKYNDEMDSIR